VEVDVTPNRVVDRILYGLGGVGPLLFFAAASMQGWLRSEYDGVAQPISALALGPHGWIQGLNFALLAVSLLALALLAKRAFRRGPASLAAPVLFVVMSIGVVVAGVYPMDAPHVDSTASGRLHDLGGLLVFPPIPAVVLILARRFRCDPAWRPQYKLTLGTGLFCLVLMAFFLSFVGPPSGPPRPASEFRGLVQRVWLLPFFSWIALVVRHAYRLTK
jgi:hypothetical protein